MAIEQQCSRRRVRGWLLHKAHALPCLSFVPSASPLSWRLHTQNHKPMFKDYRSKHHHQYNTPSSGGFWLLLIGGAIVGAVVPIMLGSEFSRGSYIGAIAGVVIWLVAASR